MRFLGEEIRVNRHDRKRGLGPKGPICPNCKKRLWPNNTFSMTIEETKDLDLPLVDGKPPIYCRYCEAEVGRVIYDLIEKLLEEGERVYDWFKAGQPSLRISADEADIICRKDKAKAGRA